MAAERTASALRTTLRAWHTVRHLRSQQVINRVARQVFVPRFQPCPECALRPAPGCWVKPASKQRAYVSDAEIELLNERRSIASTAVWNAREASPLWLYHLHYFDDLNAADASGRRRWHEDLIQRWISENRPATGVGWHPYPTSLRVVNWIKWHLGGHQLGTAALKSLADQLEWLRRRVEYHLLGNHLFENAKALVFGGCFFAGLEAEAWRQTGTALLERELREQILLDGGHFELSPMYHATILEDVLDLVNVGRLYGLPRSGALVDVARRMLSWLESMTHPDGGIALFNDATLDQAPSYATLADYADRLGIERGTAPRRSLCLLPDSGYARVSVGPYEAFLDVATVGPDYLPGHAHADTLGFELSINGLRIVVDSGTSTYEVSPERLRQRSTASHNTIVVDGASSSDVWHAFRVGRRARIVERAARESVDGVTVEAAHDGFAHRIPGALHRRSWSFAGSTLKIRDEVSGRGDHELLWSMHLHPEVVVERSGATRFTLRRAPGVLAQLSLGEGPGALDWSVADTTHHPGFGRALPARKIVGRGRVALPFRLETTLRAVSGEGMCTYYS